MKVLLICSIIIFCLPLAQAQEFNESIQSFDTSKYSKIADSIFYSVKDSAQFTLEKNFAEEFARVGVVTGNLFRDNEKHAVKYHSQTDSTLFLEILKFTNQKWHSIKTFEILQYDLWTLEDIVLFQDVNFDNVNDLIVSESYINLRASRTFNAWLTEEDEFIKVDSFNYFPNPELDSETKLLYSYISIGCTDASMYFQVAEIKEHTAKSLKRISMDCCDTIYGKNCKIEINDAKSFNVKRKHAYKFAPEFYQESLKDKLKDI